ncbi:exonuclease V [Lasiosphaeris hirsuta]|uniref:Exonuclease V n=1 Tax=Lasiosphaeris hirsuta TaxID=260670 RepID=A0AA40DTU0_9PEZI|nr:exonuclease V [Lasiosphaeris hirsuta]
MASFVSDSDSDSYGYDLTASDEEHLFTLIDSISSPDARTPAPTLAPTHAPTSGSAPTRALAPTHSPHAANGTERTASLDSYLNAVIAVNETLESITEDDLSFDLSEIEPEATETTETTGSHSHGSGSGSGTGVAVARDYAPLAKRRYSPSVPSDSASVASFVSQTKSSSTLRLLPSQDVRYPDLSRALSDVKKACESSAQSEQSAEALAEEGQSPLLRFRTFPMKPFSVSDLTAGAWCELQYYYTLTILDGKRTQTSAMKAGTKIHEKLEREVFTTPVEIDVVKREDAHGLKVWNIIQGLRMLRDTGLTREFEVWGLVDGNVVNGIIDGLSYDNPDPELEEDVISTRDSQDHSQSSQQQILLGNKAIFITDVKTRASKYPPSQAQVRGTIIQLFLYHRFLSDMASGRLNYAQVFERYGLNMDETFSDDFMAQMSALHEEIFSDGESAVTETTDSASDFYSAVSTSSQLDAKFDDVSSMRYRTLRQLLSLLKFEIHLTFPRGSNSIGHIVSVEYRYRARSKDDEVDGSVICTNTFYVEPETLDDYLDDYMRWWRGEREPRGVPLDEAFKCQHCEFADRCEWRSNLDNEAVRKAKLESAGKGGSPAGGSRKRVASIQW